MHDTPMSRSKVLVTVALLVGGVTATFAEKGLILAQELDAQGRGYTVLRVWGSPYDMGYAQASLLGDHIVLGVEQTEAFLGSLLYSQARGLMASAVWMPPEIEDELAGMVACLAITHPTAGIDQLDLKVASTAGDWLYACRSHTCWGRYVAPPIKTLSTRRLDFGSFFTSMSHHVLCAHDPEDGSPQWVNLAWPGIATAATGVNEFGTLVSLHDYQSQTDLTAGRMPRMLACRYALTLTDDPDVATHLGTAFAELRNYEMMTGSFVNYYAPERNGGVMACYPFESGPDFHNLRTAKDAWHHGEAMITTNAWTDGTYTPSDENFGADAYYNDETPKTLDSHWHLLADGSNSLHLLSVAYRDRRDMTLWADGRLTSGGRTPRLEWEWAELFGTGDVNCDGVVNNFDIKPFVTALVSPAQYAAEYPDCQRINADCNSDGVVNNFDIRPFVQILLGD